MAEEGFNPFNMNMPWDAVPDNDAESKDTNESCSDASDSCGDDGVSEPKQDIFTALEEKLKLPIGSTKEGIASAKQIVNRIKAKTALVEASGTSIAAQEKLGRLSPEQHFAECAKIRAQANRLYDISSSLMDKLNEQVDCSMDVSDKMWSAVSSMISSVGQSLERLMKIATELRKEEDLLALEIKESEDAKKLAGDDGTIDAAPDDMNKLIVFFQETEKAEQKQIEKGTKLNE